MRHTWNRGRATMVATPEWHSDLVPSRSVFDGWKDAVRTGASVPGHVRADGFRTIAGPSPCGASKSESVKVSCGRPAEVNGT